MRAGSRPQYRRLRRIVEMLKAGTRSGRLPPTVKGSHLDIRHFVHKGTVSLAIQSPTSRRDGPLQDLLPRQPPLETLQCL